jgi:hypothetical protein
MSGDDLLSNTAGYDLQYNIPFAMSPTPSPPPDNEQLSLREAIEDPGVWRQSRQGAQEEMQERIGNLRLRANRRNRQSWNPMGPSGGDSRRHQRQALQHEDDLYGENCDHLPDESQSGVIRLSAPTPPPFMVTTASEEEEGSDSTEEPPSAAVIADLLRRESLWRAESDDEDGGASPRFGEARQTDSRLFGSYRAWRARYGPPPEPIRATRVGTPSRIQPSASSPNISNLIPPHAKFFIAKNKSKITIKFNPAM